MNGTYVNFSPNDYIRGDDGINYSICSPVGGMDPWTRVSFTLSTTGCAENVQPLSEPTAGAVAVFDTLIELANAQPTAAQQTLVRIIGNLPTPGSNKPIDKRAVMKAIR